jgi:hypothetical protein
MDDKDLHGHPKINKATPLKQVQNELALASPPVLLKA